MKFVVYLDKLGFWRWRLVSRNSKIVADSGESYCRRADCLRTINRIRLLASTANVHVVASARGANTKTAHVK